MPKKFFDAYTRGLKPEDLQRLFTRDTKEAYHFFARHVDYSALEGMPWYRRAFEHVRLFFVAFTMKLSPARRVVYAVALTAAIVGLLQLMNAGRVERRGPRGDRILVSTPGFANGTGWLLIGFGLVNLLVLLEVADRLSLKNDLEVAREIQQAMLPNGLYKTGDVEMLGLSRPANTVGGDFYDILPLEDGRLVIAVGDVSGKGSPAALLMALLLAMMRTLVRLMEEQKLDPVDVMARLNVQVMRHAPGSRFITLFYGVYHPHTGELQYVNAGHLAPLLLRLGGETERLTAGGIALGMFEGSSYATGRVQLRPGDLLSVYSDGITEAENPAGTPFDETGLETVLLANRDTTAAEIGAAVVKAVERHTGDVRLADDLTILLLRRDLQPQAIAV